MAMYEGWICEQLPCGEDFSWMLQGTTALWFGKKENVDVCCVILYRLISSDGVRGGALRTALQTGRLRGFDSRWGQGNDSLTYSFRPHYGSGVTSASNRNKYQGSSLRGKGGRCIGLKILPLSYADCLKILRASTCWKPKGLSRPV
jgi:hypothetical protein